MNRTNISQGTTNATAFTGNLSTARSSMYASQAIVYVSTTTGITGDVVQNADVTPIATTTFDFPAQITFLPGGSRNNLNGGATVLSFPGPALSDIFNATDFNAYPICFHPNEGFQLKNETIMPGAGNGPFIVNVEYMEAIDF
jgi:hypothetical protein